MSDETPPPHPTPSGEPESPPATQVPTLSLLAGSERSLGKTLLRVLLAVAVIFGIRAATSLRPSAPMARMASKGPSLRQAAEVLYAGTKVETAELHEHVRAFAYAVQQGDCETAHRELYLAHELGAAQAEGRPGSALDFNLVAAREALERECPGLPAK